MNTELPKALKKTFLAAVVAMAVSGETVLAQAPEEGNKGKNDELDILDLLEEIVVTAQKRGESLQEVPISITTFNSEMLDRTGALTLTDLEQTAPSLYFGSVNFAQSGIGIRGIDDNSRNIGSEARVGVYVDGVYVGRSYIASQDLLGIQQVEVLNGPQGTLYGKNTVAGAINITTRAPTEELSVELSAETGNFDYRRVSGQVGGPIAGKKLLGSIALQKADREGFVKNILTGKDIEDVNRLAARGQLLYLPSEDWSIRMSVDYMEEDINPLLGQSVDPNDFGGYALAPDEFEIAHNLDVAQQREAKGFGLTVEHELENDFTLTSITAYRENFYQTAGFDEDSSPLDVVFSSFDEDASHFTQEVRISSPKYSNYDFLVGLFYMNQDLSTDRTSGTGVDFGGPAFVTDPGSSNTESMALFAHGNYHLTPQLELTAGLRVDYEKKDISHRIIDQTGLFTNDSQQDERSDTNISPRIGFNYFLNGDVMLYTSVSRGYKSGGWNAEPLVTYEGWEFDTESVTSYEIGVKSTLLNRRVRLNVAGFYMDFDDYQTFQFVPTGDITLLLYTNAAEVTSQGVEVTIETSIGKHLSVIANAAYTDAVYKKFENAGGLGIDLNGENLGGAPQNKVYVAADYKKPLNEWMDFLAHLSYNFTDEPYVQEANTSVQGSYGLVDARLGLASVSDRGWEVWLWAKNLTDETYEESRELAYLGFNRAAFGLPRTYGIKLGYQY